MNANLKKAVKMLSTLSLLLLLSACGNTPAKTVHVNNWPPVNEYVLHLSHDQPVAPEGDRVTLADMTELWFVNAGIIWDLACNHIDLQRAVRLRQKQPMPPELEALYANKCGGGLEKE